MAVLRFTRLLKSYGSPMIPTRLSARCIEPPRPLEIPVAFAISSAIRVLRSAPAGFELTCALLLELPDAQHAPIGFALLISSAWHQSPAPAPTWRENTVRETRVAMVCERHKELFERHLVMASD
jgi:hypothetical protein